MRKVVLLPIIKIIAYLLIPFILWSIPKEEILSGESICLFKNIFGTECWGCGFTRATYLVLHGDFITAWEYNKLIVVTLPLLTTLWIIGIIRQIKNAITSMK